MARFVGLDVHKSVIEACILDADGRVEARYRFALDEQALASFARTRLRPDDRVVLEATTNTWAVVRIIRPHVAEVVVSNPMQTRAIAQAKVKTDKVDARTLAQLLRCDFLPRVWEPSDAIQELRRLVNRRAALVADRTAVKNRIHAVLAQRLLRPPVEQLFSRAGLDWLRGLALDDEGRLLIDSDLRLFEGAEREVAGLDALLAGKAYGDERVRLLMTLPGVDVGVAVGLLAALGDIGRFRDGGHAASYLGLVPRTRQSADHCYHGPITKAGSSHVRSLLIQAAQHLRSHPGPLGAFYRRLARKKSPNVAVTAAARKLVTVAWQLLTKGEPYRYASPEPTQRKLGRLRIAATGQRRRTGPPRGSGSPARPRSATGDRATKPLSRVYAEEGLPPLGAMPAGEVRHVRGAGVEGFVRSIGEGPGDPCGPDGRSGREARPRPLGVEAASPKAARSGRPGLTSPRSRAPTARPVPVGKDGSSGPAPCGTPRVVNGRQ
jgi:transposase